MTTLHPGLRGHGCRGPNPVAVFWALKGGTVVAVETEVLLLPHILLGELIAGSPFVCAGTPTV